MAPKLRAERTQPRAGVVAAEDPNLALTKSIRASLERTLKGKKLIEVKIRRIEGRRVEGFLKIDSEKGERLLVDFNASMTLEGALSSLEVDGRKISLATGPAPRRS